MDNEEGVEIPLRLHVHKEKNHVIFAEANSDFVDALFSFLTLPLGIIVRILKNQCDLQPGEIGCLGRLYESVANLDVNHLWSEGCKKMLLNPRNAAESRCQRIKLNIDDTGPSKYLVCHNWQCSKPEILLNSLASKCSCGENLSEPTNVMSSMTHNNEGKGGAFITEAASFIVTDDLQVIPNLPTIVLEMFEKFGISDLHALHAVDEINLNIGYKEMIALLKCSLQSNSPLTATFLSKRTNFGCLVKPSLANSDIGNSSENEEGKVEETNKQTITIKLVIQKSNNKILFAHSEENFVDFLFGLLTIPLGGVARILNANISCGSVWNLYNSLLTLKLERHFKSQILKSMLVNPQVAVPHLSKNQLLSFSEADAEYYRYSNLYEPEKRILYLVRNKVKCAPYKESCEKLSLKDPKYKGQYTRPSMFIVTDDMDVIPLSLFSVVSYLQIRNIPLSDVEEQIISIGMAGARKILNAAFESTLVFTNAGINIQPKNIKQEQP